MALAGYLPVDEMAEHLGINLPYRRDYQTVACACSKMYLTRKSGCRRSRSEFKLRSVHRGCLRPVRNEIPGTVVCEPRKKMQRSFTLKPARRFVDLGDQAARRS